MIEKQGNKWVLYSKGKRKKLFESTSKEKVKQREKEINYFKRKK